MDESFITFIKVRLRIIVIVTENEQMRATALCFDVSVGPDVVLV